MKTENELAPEKLGVADMDVRKKAGALFRHAE
jgi:hypothetical protein